MPVRDFLADIGQGTQNALQQLAFIERARAMQPGSQENKLRQLQMQQAEQQFASQEREISEAQRIDNTKWMLYASEIAMEKPEARPFLLEEGQRRGIFDPGMTPDQATDEAIMDMNRQAKIGLAGWQQSQRGGAGASARAFNPITIINPETMEKRMVAPTFDPQTRQAKLEPFDMPAGFQISTETPEEKRAAEVLFAGEKTRATAEAKAGVEMETKPKIIKAVKQAESQAKSRGESLSEYGAAKAALPGIQEVVGKLKTLSDIATYTIAGRAFDVAAKELGFGATKGATARAKMSSLVDNQILPLLKQTFGSAFTEAEGERLKNTMLDINASPDQKKQMLDVFINQKIRELETKERELGVTQELPASQAQPQQTQAVDIDALVNKYGNP